MRFLTEELNLNGLVFYRPVLFYDDNNPGVGPPSLISCVKTTAIDKSTADDDPPSLKPWRMMIHLR